jgi:predicted MFS family arabinose efflux permease
MKTPVPPLISEPFISKGVLPRTFSALRHRNFRLFWFSQIISLSGTWMMTVAQSWLVYRLTGSAFALGYVTFIGILPTFPIAMLGGAIVDRFPKRRLLIITQSAFFVLSMILAGLIWTGLVQIWHIMILVFLFGALFCIDQPARQAIIIELVGPEDLMNGVALYSSVFNAARAIGPAIGGIVLAAAGEAGCYFINGLSFLIVIGALLLMRMSDQPCERENKSLGSSMIDGFKYISGQPQLLALIGLMAVTGLFGTPYMNLMPVFARNVLFVGGQGMGFLMAAVGIGAVLGALGVANLARPKQPKWLATGSILFPLFLIFFASSRQFSLAFVALVLAGVAFIMQQSIVLTTVQLMAEDRMRGRVMSLYGVIFVAMQQTGNLLGGGAAQLWSAPLAVTIGAVICLFCALGFNYFYPRLRLAP